MASDTHAHPRLYSPWWPPDDTQESIVGTDLHQTAIINLRPGINEIASLLSPAGNPPPWQALSPVMLLGCKRPDGSPYTTFPDVFVYRHPIDRQRGSVAITLDGPPVLIVEVLSEAAYAAISISNAARAGGCARENIRSGNRMVWDAGTATGSMSPSASRA